MAREPLIEKLSDVAKGDLADFKALLQICERELVCLADEELNGLSEILEGKEALIRKIQENSDQNAALWSQIDDWEGEEPALDGLSQAVEDIRETIEMIQGAEARIAEILSSRADEVQKALGSLIRGGKAMGAYKPIRSYAPRFIDKKE